MTEAFYSKQIIVPTSGELHYALEVAAINKSASRSTWSWKRGRARAMRRSPVRIK